MPCPFYLQITKLLIRDIAAGRFIDAECLPPERYIASDLGIAVGTLRQALKVMTDKGLVDRIQGSGNYVQAKADALSVYALLRIELLTGGGLPTARVLNVDRLTMDPRRPAFGTSRKGHRIRRLRYLSGQIAAVKEIWLDASHIAHIAQADLSESLYLYSRQKLNPWMARAEDCVGLGPLPEWSPTEFADAPGTQQPMITCVSWDRSGASVEASRTWYDPKTVAYVAHLT